MKSRLFQYRHAIIAATCMFGLLGYAAFSVPKLFRESIGPTPTPLYPAVPLDGARAIEKIRWSPSGAFILIEAATDTGASYPTKGFVVVLDLANRSVAARIESARHASWGADDSVWVWSDDQWNVFAPPFQSSVIWDSGYGEEPNGFDLNTRSERLAVAEYSEASEDWTIRVFENAKESFALQLKPKYTNSFGMMRRPSLTFSPSGRWIAIVISGWVGYEQPGPEELWLVDVEEQHLSHLHTGKYKWWQIFDADTQSLEPSWTPSEDAVVYGDFTYGIEELSIPGAESRAVIGKRSEVHDVLVSSTGRWIAFERWPGEEEDANRYDRCLGAVSRDGRKILHLPREFVHWPYMYKDWHPKKDVLAVLKKDVERRRHDLFYWDLGEGDPNSDG